MAVKARLNKVEDVDKVFLEIKFDGDIVYKKAYDALSVGLEVAFVCDDIKIDVPEDTDVRVEIQTPYYTWVPLDERFPNDGVVTIEKQIMTAKIESEKGKLKARW